MDNKKIFTRHDVVVYDHVMPFRSVGGKGSKFDFSSQSAADAAMAYYITWSPDGEEPIMHSPIKSPMTQIQPVLPRVRVDTPMPLTFRSHSSISSSPPQSPSSYSPLPLHFHESSSSRLDDGKNWFDIDNHCSNSKCNLGKDHPGICSDAVPILDNTLPSQSTRAARARVAFVPTLQTTEEDTDDDIDLDAMLCTAYSPELIGKPYSFICDDNSDTVMAEFLTCIDAYAARIDMSLLNPIAKTRKSSYWMEKIRRSGKIKPGLICTNVPKIAEFNPDLPIPNTIEEARQSPNWDVPNGYKFATEKECGAWIDQGVLETADAPGLTKLINLRALYTVKLTKTREFKKAKLRIIISCHSRVAKQGEHYFENYSQTVKWPNVRTVCAQACNEGFTIVRQWDTGAAFLHADIEPGAQVLVSVPEAMQEIFKVGPVARVLKAAYGLPGAPRGFYKFVCSIFTNPALNMIKSKVDEAVFTLREGREYLHMCMWVDDFLCISNSQRLYDKCKKHYFEHVLEAEDEPLELFLGINFEVNVQKQTIRLWGERAINAMVQQYGQPQRQSQIPCLEENSDLPSEPLPEIGSPLWHRLETRAVRYRSLVPSMLYLCTTCRPDVAYIIGILCRCQANPSERHLEAADVCLAYLLTTKELAIQYGITGSERGLHMTYSPLKSILEGLADSDWAVGPSISGFIVFLAGGPVMWISKKQPVTALSSTEAEYYASSVCAVELLASRLFLASIGAEQILPTPLHVDNSACVSMAKDFNSCKRAKHIDRRINFLTDYQELGHLQVIHIPTAMNTADIFTKPLRKLLFLKHRLSMLI